MKILWKKIGIIIFLISIMGAGGCAGKEQQSVYEDTLSAMTEDQAYAFVNMGGNQVPVLLLTDGTYPYEENIEAGLYCDVYYMWDEEVQNLGRVESMGTAYPVRYDEEGIYVGGPHFAAKYVLNNEEKQLILAEYAEETFDTNAHVTYTYAAENGEKQIVKDDSYLKSMFEKFGKAAVVNFEK